MSQFSAILLDLDDTMIPSALRGILKSNFNIDIFEILFETSIKKLQSDVVSGIKAIQDSIFTQYPDNDIIMAVVSNGTTNWLKGTIGHKYCKFQTLGKFFAENKAPILSAADSALKYLTQKFGEETARDVMNTTGNEKENRWMWKYTTFTSVISKYKKDSGKKCNQVICIGDGLCEYQAIKHYAKKHATNIEYIRMLRAPTVSQLREQWRYITLYFDQKCMTNLKDALKNRDGGGKYKPKVIEFGDETIKFKWLTLDLYEKIKHDNNGFATGKDQLTAIAGYFQDYLKSIENDQLEEAQIQNIFKAIESKLVNENENSPKVAQIKAITNAAMSQNAILATEMGKYRKSLLYFIQN